MSLQIITRSMVKNGFVPPKALPTQPDPYQDRLLKLIPAEVVSVYLAVSVLLPGPTTSMQDDAHAGLRIGAFVILLVANFFIKRKGGVTDSTQLIITSLAFIIWVISLGGPVKFHIGTEESTLVGAVLTPLFTLLAPVLYN